MKTKPPLTIVVLGANGFVGGHIVDELSQSSKIHIRAFDRFSHEPKFKAAPNISIHKGDFNDTSSIKNVLKGADYVLHCFSATTPFLSDKDPFLDITNNLLTSVRIFELCGKMGIKKIGFISSGGAIYGKAGESGHANELDAPSPISPYGIVKLAIEHYLEYFKRKDGMNYIVYRLTNPYGPRQVAKHNQGVIPIFLSKMLGNEEITIYGDGHSSRDYIYILDAAKMIATSFLSANKQPVYNIGSGRQTSLNQIIKELEKVTGKKAKIIYKEVPPSISHRTSVDVSRFAEEYGLEKHTSLETGLQETLEEWPNTNS